MIFIESPIFTEDVAALMPDESYQELQMYLAEHPEAGPVIKDTGGLRKIRWKLPGKGKRGGVRVIYYSLTAAWQIRMIFIYEKSGKDDLTAKEKKILRKLNEGWDR